MKNEKTLGSVGFSIQFYVRGSTKKIFCLRVYTVPTQVGSFESLKSRHYQRLTKRRETTSALK